jgi:hypothetical protein
MSTAKARGPKSERGLKARPYDGNCTINRNTKLQHRLRTASPLKR